MKHFEREASEALPGCVYDVSGFFVLGNIALSYDDAAPKSMRWNANFMIEEDEDVIDSIDGGDAPTAKEALRLLSVAIGIVVKGQAELNKILSCGD